MYFSKRELLANFAAFFSNTTGNRFCLLLRRDVISHLLGFASKISNLPFSVYGIYGVELCVLYNLSKYIDREIN
jgi:hypothetical protein